MSTQEKFSVASARAAAERDEVDAWVAEFLSSPGSDNAPLAHELTSRQRWWLGPVQLPFSHLHRLIGPPGDPVLSELDDDDHGRIEDMEESIDEGWDPPPLIVSYRSDLRQLVLEDGNHRVEGLRRNGERSGWSLVCFDDPDEREAFVVPDEEARPAS
jgi:hypothetical protein